MIDIFALVYTAVFGGVSVVVFYYTWRHYQAQRDIGKDAGGSTTGSAYRTYLHLFLALGNLGEAASFAAQIHVEDTTKNLPLSFSKILLHTLPALQFLSAYSILVQFWVKLYFVRTSKTFAHLLLLYFNVITYGTYLVLIIVGIVYKNISMIECGTTFLVFSSQVILAVAASFFGISVYFKLRPTDLMRPDSIGRKLVARRVLTLALLVVQALLLRSFFLMAIFFTPGKLWGLSDIIWEMITCPLCELIPTIVILILTQEAGTNARRPRKREKRRITEPRLGYGSMENP